MSTILAIDLGKYNSVLCWYDAATHAAVVTRRCRNPEMRGQRRTIPTPMTFTLRGMCMASLDQTFEESETVRHGDISVDTQLPVLE